MNCSVGNADVTTAALPSRSTSTSNVRSKTTFGFVQFVLLYRLALDIVNQSNRFFTDFHFILAVNPIPDPHFFFSQLMWPRCYTELASQFLFVQISQTVSFWTIFRVF